METEQYIALIIDDDSTATSELRKGLAAHPEFTVAGAATTATAGERLLFRLRPDILFLDVELPDMQGVAFLNSIKERIDWRMSVVFYSMHSKYILSAMRESAFDYLLKPFEQEELDGIITRYKENLGKTLQPTAQQTQQGNALKNCFLAATVTGYRMIHVEEIGYFEHKGLRKQWHAYLASVVHRQRQLPRHDLRQRMQALPSLRQSGETHHIAQLPEKATRNPQFHLTVFQCPGNMDIRRIGCNMPLP